MKRKILGALLVLTLLVQLPGCGTLMFSEREGQERGKIDTNVVIMDGIGLLFFVVPGLVSYFVDFASGAIYLPPEGEKGEGPFIWDAPGPRQAATAEETASGE